MVGVEGAEVEDEKDQAVFTAVVGEGELIGAVGIGSGSRSRWLLWKTESAPVLLQCICNDLQAVPSLLPNSSQVCCGGGVSAIDFVL